MINPETVIWIDRNTGTWGGVADLVFIDANIEGMRMDPEGDEYTCYSSLDDMSDSGIIKFSEESEAAGSGFVGHAMFME